MKVSELLDAICRVTKKAEKLASRIRSEEALFQLLVEEKKGEHKNKRFLQDFKTLADVLVQELVKFHLSDKFPGIEDNVYGEESNKFTNTLGETIVIEIKQDRHDMTTLLAKVLDGNIRAAELLTEVVLSSTETQDNSQYPESLHSLDIPLEDVGIWIDPIDSTAQYIHGQQSQANENGVYSEGLPCVVILIGAYHKTLGKPILGVINQPFCSKENDLRWTGRTLWGVSYQDVNECSLTHNSPNTHEHVNSNKIILSTSESKLVQTHLMEQHKLVFAAGAGYKLLCVIDGLVGVYLLTKPSTFKWDTCAPHAILKSLGGKIINYSSALEIVKSKKNLCIDSIIPELDKCEVLYHEPDNELVNKGEKWSNREGLLAYFSPKEVISILKAIV